MLENILFAELKAARQLARQSISRAQAAQKTRYDKESCSNIRGDLVMLKVQPRFKLDRSFRGPYRVYTVTDTCAHIRPIDKPNDDLITVSLQRLSRCCNGGMDTVKPWMGQGKSRMRRKLRRTNQQRLVLEQVLN